MIRSTLVLALASLSSLTAQNIGTLYGPSYLNQPGILAFGSATPGGSFSGLTPDRGGACYVFMGFNATNVPIPFGQTVLVDPIVTDLALPLSTGIEFFYPQNIPNDPSLVGLHLYIQFAHFFATSYQLTRGVDVVIL